MIRNENETKGHRRTPNRFSNEITIKKIIQINSDVKKTRERKREHTKAIVNQTMIRKGLGRMERK